MKYLCKIFKDSYTESAKYTSIKQMFQSKWEIEKYKKTLKH